MALAGTYIYDLLHPSLVNIERLMGADAITKMRGSPERPSVAWQEMAQEWIVLRDLRGGTRGMRLSRTRNLPMFPKERQQDYNWRVDNSFLLDMVGDTIDEMVSKPFSKGITFKCDKGEKIPQWVEDLNLDFDGQGTSVHDFAKNAMLEALWWGIVHFAVDASNLPDELPSVARIKDFKDARPRVRLVPGPNMLSWSREKTLGRPIREVRFYERVVDDHDITELLHVWDKETLVEMRRDYQAEKFVPSSSSPNRAGKLPVVTFYAKKTGEFTAAPPFMDIAELNVDHWQRYSDFRSILHMASVPFLHRRGISKEEAQRNPVTLGVSRVQNTTNPQSDIRWVEIGGQSIAVSKDSLQALVDAAREKGAKPLFARGPVTATGEYRADEKATSDLQAWCRAEERALTDVYTLAQKSKPGLEPLPAGFKVCIHTEFDLRDRSADALAGLRQDQARGLISSYALVSEIVRRGVLPEDFDMKADAVLAAKEKADQMQQEIAMVEATAGGEKPEPGIEE